MGHDHRSCTGQIDWLPTESDLGAHTVTVQVLDSQGAGVALSYELNVRAANTPPVILSAPPTEGAIGATYFYQVAAEDVDQDPLTFTLANAPSGMSINAQTGRIEWTPDVGQDGSHDVEVTVTDPIGGSISQSYTIEVADGLPNQLPVITSAANVFATVGQSYSYDVEANDLDGDTLTYALLNGPAGMTIDEANGLVEWTPTAADIGSVLVEIAVTDPSGGGSLQGFGLQVLAINNAPEINSAAPTEPVAPGGTFRYDLLATDADGDFLTYELITSPAGMVVDGLGRMFWRPEPGQVGSNSVEVRVTDTRGASDTEIFLINVETDTAAPEAVILLSANPVNVGEMVDIRVSAIDNVGVESIVLIVGGVIVPLDANATARVEMTTVGSIVAEATVTDGEGNSTVEQVSILVSDPNDVDGPVLLISSPSDGGAITSLTDIIGSVTDDTLVSYRLLLGDVQTRDLKVLASGTESVSEDVLGQIDPTILENGTYVVRLEAFDASGNGNFIEQEISIEGDLKLGDFSLTFTDMIIPVSGIDIVLSRTYSSLRADENGEIGYGWNLDYRDVQLQVSVADASDFDKEYGFYTPYRDGTKVYVTLPGGKRETFTFTPTVKGLPGLVYYTPNFTPGEDTTSTLSVQSANLSNVGGEYHGFLGGLPYNPAAPEYGTYFTLVTEDGLVYRINADDGQIDRITGPNGNQLQFSDTGVTSSTGVDIEFERDSSGRITAAIDPKGDRVEYTYDAAGDLVAVVDRNQNETTFEYSPTMEHFLTDVIDPLGNSGIRGEYDSEGRLISLVDANGNAVDISNDPNSNSQTIVDELGNQTIFVYDQRGNTTSETDALGNTTTSAYDSNNNLLSTTDALDRTVSYTYDSFDNVLTITDPAGAVTTYTYANPSRGLVGTITDPLGNTLTYLYDAKGNLLGIDDESGATSLISYDSQGNALSTTNPITGATQFTYDSNGNVITATDVSGTVTEFTYNALGQLTSRRWTQTIDGVVTNLSEANEYDAEGNLIREVNALGHETLYAYDGNNRLTSSTDALGRTTKFVYDASGNLTETILPDSTPVDDSDNPRVVSDFDELGRLISETDELGRTTRFVYDELGQLLETILPDGTPADDSDNARLKSEYDAVGRKTAEIDANGNRTEFEYDVQGNLVLIRDALNHETRIEYDAMGRQTKLIDALGQETEYAYDGSGRVTVTTYNDDTKVEFVYAASGLLTSQIDQNGNGSSFEYDALGRITKVIEANGAETTYAYDELGNVVSLTDANGSETEYLYDVLSRRTSVVRPLGESDLNEFDANGNLVAYTDFNGDRHTFEYDVRDRLVTKQIVGDSAVEYSYLDNGLVSQVEDFRGTTNYAYDEQNRLLSETSVDGNVLSYQYDLGSNVTLINSLAGGTAYEYDALNRIVQVTDIDSGETNYAYDELSRLTTTTFANGVQESRGYTANSYLASITYSAGGSVFDSLTYTHDAKGQRLSVTEFGNRRVEYQYDSVDRLIGESTFDSGGAVADRQVSFTYDAVGNRLSTNDSTNGITTSTYDANDRLITSVNGGSTTTFGYDLNGNRTSKSDGTTTATYAFSGEGRLLSADVNGDGTADVEYAYDPQGNRVARTEGGNTVFYQVDANRELAEVLVDYTSGGVVETSYTVGSGLISQHRNDVHSYYHTDSIGSVRTLSDEAGALANSYVYSAFGETQTANETVANEFLFDGQRRDATTGLDYLRARNYDSSTGQMIGVDPLDGTLSRPGSLHNYTYAGNNPINASDPTGQFSLVEVSFSSSSLLTIQKSFASAAQGGLKRVAAIADKLLAPGTQMQNIGLQIAFSDRSDRDLGYDIYLAGTYYRIAGFSAMQVAIAGIYSDTLKNIATASFKSAVKSSLSPAAKQAFDSYGKAQEALKIVDGRLKIKEKFNKAFEFKKPPKPIVDQLIQKYVDDSNAALRADGLARYLAGTSSQYEKQVANAQRSGNEVSFALSQLLGS